MLFLPTAPPEAIPLLVDTLARIPSGGDAINTILNAAPDQLSTAVGHRVFVMEVEAVAQSRGLAAAKFAAWRYLIMERQNPIAAVEFTVDGSQALQFSNVNAGPFVTATCDAIVFAEHLPEVQKSDFELAGLWIPGIFVIALWLKNQADANDLLIPLPPFNSVLLKSPISGSTLVGIQQPPPLRAFSVTDFFQILQLAAIESFDQPRDQNR